MPNHWAYLISSPSASFHWATTIIKLSILSLMVRAGYVCVAIIHGPQTWTTGSLSCAQMLMHAIAHGGVRTPKHSLHWKLTLGRKSLVPPENRTCVCDVTVRCCHQLSDIQSPLSEPSWGLAAYKLGISRFQSLRWGSTPFGPQAGDSSCQFTRWG